MFCLSVMLWFTCTLCLYFQLVLSTCVVLLSCANTTVSHSLYIIILSCTFIAGSTASRYWLLTLKLTHMQGNLLPKRFSVFLAKPVLDPFLHKHWYNFYGTESSSYPVLDPATIMAHKKPLKKPLCRYLCFLNFWMQDKLIVYYSGMKVWITIWKQGIDSWDCFLGIVRGIYGVGGFVLEDDGPMDWFQSCGGCGFDFNKGIFISLFLF